MIPVLMPRRFTQRQLVDLFPMDFLHSSIEIERIVRMIL